MLWTLALVVGLAAARPALASDEGAAKAAADVVELHCAHVAAGQATEYAEALAAVTPVLLDVSQAYDASGAAYLLYWRGVLSSCVGQTERGVTDLVAFLEGVGDDPDYAAQARDARRRLARLRGEPPEPTPAPRGAAGAVAGAALLGTGGVLGGLSGWQGATAAAREAEFVAGRQAWSITDGIGQEWEDAAAASNGLLAASVGAGVAGLVVVVITAATGREPKATATVLPLPRGGAALQVGGRW